MKESSGHILTFAEIDREITSRAAEIDAIAATMVELDKHPGLLLLRRFPPTGRTEQRWTPARTALDSMWEDFTRLRTLLERVRVARARRRIDALDREELTTLLRGQPIELARTPIPMGQRQLGGPGEHVVCTGFADMLERMRSAFPMIVDVLEAVDAVNSRVMSETAPLQTELERVGAAHPELRALAADIADLVTRAATDPLGLGATEIEDRLTDLSARMRGARTLRTELAEIGADWDGAVGGLRVRVEALLEVCERAHRARIAVERAIVSGPLPRQPDVAAAFSAELTALHARPADPVALWELRRRLTEAFALATANEELAQGLLDRRAELRGRLSGYRAKAARLGVSEHRDVLASGRIAAGLLDRTPCDLAAVTRAITDYRQLIAQKSGRQP
ncbi:hypothetical protein [Nocardia jejuensis]|uniref:hypothetical protein n=1 Tax=Nocardia jejuensis TaxID=328049 RepID=UPI000833DF4B|nr:hypothetical protein [Nocardia jejuensis]